MSALHLSNYKKAQKLSGCFENGTEYLLNARNNQG